MPPGPSPLEIRLRFQCEAYESLVRIVLAAREDSTSATTEFRPLEAKRPASDSGVHRPPGGAEADDQALEHAGGLRRFEFPVNPAGPRAAARHSPAIPASTGEVASTGVS